MNTETRRKAKKRTRRGEQPSKAMKIAERNARLRAEKLPDKAQFGIYLDYGGGSLFLVSRKDAALYELLQPGVSLGDLRRFRPRRGTKSDLLGKSLAHIIRIAEDELGQMYEYGAGPAAGYGWEL